MSGRAMCRLASKVKACVLLDVKCATRLQFAVQITETLVGESPRPQLLAMWRREHERPQRVLGEAELAAHEIERASVTAVLFFEAEYFCKPARVRCGCRRWRVSRGWHGLGVMWVGQLPGGARLQQRMERADHLDEGSHGEFWVDVHEVIKRSSIE